VKTTHNGKPRLHSQAADESVSYQVASHGIAGFLFRHALILFFEIRGVAQPGSAGTEGMGEAKVALKSLEL
jgi:hypothetical protein